MIVPPVYDQIHALYRLPRRGFTLLEVMIAMAILSITLVAVFQSQSQSISMAGSSRFLTTASLLAQSRMVEIADTEIEVLKKISLTVTNGRMAVRNGYRLTLYKVVIP